jgi:hypothetical protein
MSRCASPPVLHRARRTDRIPDGRDASPTRGRPRTKDILVLFTRNDHGVWYFADALGRAGRNWQAALHDERERTHSAKIASRLSENLGMFELDDFTPASPPEPFDAAAYERQHRDRWASTIATNLHRLFATYGGVRLVDHIGAVYGDVLGQAWERHVRAALQRLHTNGIISDDGKGDNFWRREIPVHIPRHRPPPHNNTTARRSAAGDGS